MRFSTWLAGVIALELWGGLYAPLGPWAHPLWFALTAGWLTAGLFAVAIAGGVRMMKGKLGGKLPDAAALRMVRQAAARGSED